MSFVSALDKASTRPSNGSSHALEQRVVTSLRFLKHVEGIEITGLAKSWDAKTCFVVLVSVKDDEIRSISDAVLASLEVVKPTKPFQIERTPKEFGQLMVALHKWANAHDSNNSNASCAFCAPFVSSDVSTGLFARWSVPKKSQQQWEDWLNACIRHVRATELVSVPQCDGGRHIPSLLARFLLQEFASDLIF
ncbi:hypothetical protein PINS_up011234 [Pythium insidiosum]|nr:hypothetical protein PINS_up011234 [Pythium insidiosum]